MSTKTTSRRDFVAATGAMMLATAAPGKALAQGLRKVTFLTDVTPYGKHALFYPALENGYFRDAGLDVTFQSGKGSADVAVKVAAKAADFALCDAPTGMLARSRGVKVKQFMMVHYRAMNNVVTLTSNPVRTPKEMMGKSFGATSGDAPRVALPALARINDFDISKVTLVTIESAAKAAMLMTKRVDGVLSYSTATPVMAASARRIGEAVVEMNFADFGLDIYSNGIIARDESFSEDPELVRKFAQALVRSFVFAVEQPVKALDIFMKYNGAANRDIARLQFEVAVKHLMVQEVKEHGIGPMSEKKMAFTLDIVRQYYGLESPVALADTFTNDFVKAGQLPA